MKTDSQRVVEAIHLLEERGYVVLDISGPVRRAVTSAMEYHTKAIAELPKEDHQTMRLGEARFLIGVGKSTFWKLARTDPTFPPRRRVGPRTVVWNRDELLAWLAARPKG